MARSFALLLASALALAACDTKESDPPTVVDQPPETAAQISTDVACEYAERCGQISITCPDCLIGQDCSCHAELYEVPYDTCVQELQPDFETGFACEPLTAEEEAAVDACLAVLPTHECLTVEEALAWVNGGGGDDPRSPIPECEVLEDIRYRCFEYEPDPDAMVPEPAD